MKLSSLRPATARVSLSTANVQIQQLPTICLITLVEDANAQLSRALQSDNGRFAVLTATGRKSLQVSTMFSFGFCYIFPSHNPEEYLCSYRIGSIVVAPLCTTSPPNNNTATKMNRAESRWQSSSFLSREKQLWCHRDGENWF